MGGGESKEFPGRFGYYVGLRAVEELGNYKLRELAHMSPERAKPVLFATVDQLIEKAGGCRK